MGLTILLSLLPDVDGSNIYIQCHEQFLRLVLHLSGFWLPMAASLTELLILIHVLFLPGTS